MSWQTFAENFSSFLTATSTAEWIAIVTALLYVLLAAAESIWCWPFGIISSGIYVWFNYELKLYSDAGLSVYYCLVGIYGWYAWVSGKAHRPGGALLHRAALRTIGVALLTGAAGSVLLGWLSDTYTDSPVPYFDGTLTAFSFVATWMQARKMLQNWLFWIVVDGAYVVLYFYRNSPATALLFVLYTIISISAYFQWRKKLTRSAA